MRVLIIASLALLACAHADGHPPIEKGQFEKFNEMRAELRAKLNSMNDEERHNTIQMIVEHMSNFEKFDEVYGKLKAATPEERKAIHQEMGEKMPPHIREKFATMSDTEREKIQEKLDQFAVMSTDERQAVVMKIQEELEKPVDKDHGHAHKFDHMKVDLIKKLREMNDEDRKEKIKKVASDMTEFFAKFDKTYEKFQAATPEEREKLQEEMVEKLPPQAREKFDAMTEEEKKMVHDKIEKFAEMSGEERKALIGKVQKALKRASRIKTIHPELHHKMKETFAAMTPEEREQLHEKLQHFHQGEHPPMKWSDEYREKLLAQLESMTPEQREEVRKQLNSGMVPLPQPAIPEDQPEEVRNPQEDILINNEWV